MARILVTGGTGQLGSAVVAQVREAGHIARVMSRRPAPEQRATDMEWAQADLVTGKGLAAALADVEVVVHCASDPAGDTYESDVLGTRRLLQEARQSGLEHFLYISIVGIDRVPYAYYQYKLATELAVVESGVPYSILRATQFHEFVDFLLQPLLTVGEGALRVPAGVHFQSIATADVAAFLLPYLTKEPHGRLPELGGPAIMTLEEMARVWLEAQGWQRTIVTTDGAGDLSLPLASFRQGFNTVPDNAYGRVTWATFVQKRVAVD